MEIRNERGVVITAVHERTPADLIELLPGMVITEVNHQRYKRWKNYIGYGTTLNVAGNYRRQII